MAASRSSVRYGDDGNPEHGPPMLPSGRMVLGAAQFGQRYGNGRDRSAPSDRQVAEILRLAADLGVGDIDTARAYGDSELAIGAARSAFPGLRVVTKVRPLTTMLPGGAATSPPHEVIDAVHTSIAESLGALRCERVDALLLHRAADLAAGGGAAGRALESLVADGRAARWGVSVSSPEELRTALRLPGLRYIQLPFNLLDRRWLDAGTQQALARRPEVHITVRSALLQGLLAGSDPARWPRVLGVDAAGTIAHLQWLAERFDRSLLGLAIGYVLGHDFVDAVVLGVRRPGQLDDLAAAVAAPPLSPDRIREVNARIPVGPPDLIDPSRWPRS